MKSISMTQDNEQGSILIIVLITLVLLTMMGISVTRSTSVELQIAGNEKYHKIAFYAAEAARGYVVQKPELYGKENITLGETRYFPNNADASETYSFGSQSFNGDVAYIGSFNVPRGKGFEAGKFKAHKYRMTCNGYGPVSAESKLKTGFYRIVF